MGVWLAHKFDAKAEHPIANEEKGQHGAMGPAPQRRFFPGLSLKRPEQHKEHQSFEKGFVELGRVPGQGPTIGKNHTPRYICYPPIQLTIDEVP